MAFSENPIRKNGFRASLVQMFLRFESSLTPILTCFFNNSKFNLLINYEIYRNNKFLRPPTDADS
ncbi:MAG: hypothetical protein II716_04260, partial [Treponema sp.]|nr:hypothetical protein [Treponema sp.]